MYGVFAQVREQEKLLAKHRRKKFKQKEKTELQLLGDELKVCRF